MVVADFEVVDCGQWKAERGVEQVSFDILRLDVLEGLN